MWHIDAEIIALMFMLVIAFDVMKTTSYKSRKDNIFSALLIATICAIVLDIISSLAMIYAASVPGWFIQVSLMLYFIVTPMLPMMWQLYAISITVKNSKRLKLYLWLTTVPVLLYAVVVLFNPLSGWLFSLSPENVYAREILFDSMFAVFYGYSLSTIILACVNFKKVERTTCIVLATFPIIAGLGVYLQQILTGYLITGAAFTLVLFITYMFLQNRKVTRDQLTGLNNRLSFTSMATKLANGSENGYILTVALDDFKIINQTFGQKNGDHLLCQVAEYIIGISPNKMAYRYGGDMFTLVLRRTNEHDALLFADLIMKRFESSFFIQKLECSISACIGVVEYPGQSMTEKHSIINAIDFAIFQAKKHGKSQVALFNENLVSKLERKHAVGSALKRAMTNNSFQVYIQPIYHMEEKKFLFGEALLRLQDDTLGKISPVEFIPIAEETGQIVEITYFVLEQVCEFLKTNSAILRDEVSVSVNFSIVQFMQNNMVERVKEILERYQISPQLIKIEVTESIIADSFDDIKTAMDKLSAFGISFALDDYGQGYSNISYLVNLPFTFVKLDKSIIDNISTDNRFIKALVPMFRSLKKIMVSEGVETKEQVDILHELSCDAIQGFYYAMPMPMPDALKVFEKNSN